MKRLITLAFAAVLLHSLSAAGQTLLNNRLVFVANLTGEQEVPSVTTNATGLATLIVSEDLSQIDIYGIFNSLSGAVTGCHIHNALPGSNGGVVFDLSSGIDAQGRLDVSFAVSPDFFEKALTQAFYLNVHTAANPNGEIRGQFVLQTDNAYGVVLTGSQEVPAVNTNASGVGYLIYSPGDFKARYRIAFHGLSGPVTNSHIHSGAAGVIGPVVVGLDAPGIFIQGEIDLTAVPADFTQKLEEEALYVNIHTAANPTGEIRGQLRRLGPIHFEMTLSGDGEVPPVTTGASGVGIAAISADLNTIEYAVQGSGLSSTAAHFHQGVSGTAGGVLVGLTAAAQPSLYFGSVAVPAGAVPQFLNSGVYVNLHTAAHPGGEIRAQLQPELRHAYAFDMCGQQESPQSSSGGTGIGVVTHDFLNTHLNYRFLTNGLSGPITAAHFHEGSFGSSGGVLTGLLNSAVGGSGQFPIDGNFATKFFQEQVYLNTHTDDFPAGEIRGQVLLNTELCSGLEGTSEKAIADAGIFPNPAQDIAFVRFASSHAFVGSVRLFNLTGQVVFEDKQQVENGQNNFGLELNGIPPGIYFGIVEDDEAAAAKFKLVKQ